VGLKVSLPGWRVIVGCVFAPALLVVSVVGAIDPQANPAGFVLLQLGLFLPILAAGSERLLIGLRASGLDRLLCLSVLAAMIYSAVSLYWVVAGDASAAGQVYLGVAGLTLVLYLLGRHFEERGARRAEEQAGRLYGQYIKTKSLDAGERVVVGPGERVPADGVILAGESALDERLVTGVGMPVDKRVGDTVFVGSINKTGELTIEVKPAGIGAVLDCAAVPANKISRQSDRLGGKFVVVFAALAVVAGLAYLIAGQGDAYHALSVALGVLVAVCPAAIGVAGPIAAMAGAGKSAEQGVVVKDPGELELAHRVDVVILDKTGTITAGKPALSDILPDKGVEKSRLLLLAASAAEVSDHPVMRAIVDRAREERLVPETAERYQVLPGRGLRVNIGDRIYHLGDTEMIAQCKIQIQNLLSFEAYRLKAEGKTPLYLAENGRLLGILAMADLPKNSSAPAIKELIVRGLDIVMVTGDARWPAGKVAGAVGITQLVARAGPQEKVSQVRRFQEMGKRVCMVGDGISDAEALAAADVGVAIGREAAGEARQAANIIVDGDDLGALPCTLRNSRATDRATRQNMFISFGYALLCVAVAAGALYPVSEGFLSPGVVLAAVCLAAGSVMVNAVRLAVGS